MGELEQTLSRVEDSERGDSDQNVVRHANKIAGANRAGRGDGHVDRIERDEQRGGTKRPRKPDTHPARGSGGRDSRRRRSLLRARGSG